MAIDDHEFARESLKVRGEPPFPPTPRIFPLPAPHNQDRSPSPSPLPPRITLDKGKGREEQPLPWDIAKLVGWGRVGVTHPHPRTDHGDDEGLPPAKRVRTTENATPSSSRSQGTSYYTPKTTAIGTTQPSTSAMTSASPFTANRPLGQGLISRPPTASRSFLDRVRNAPDVNIPAPTLSLGQQLQVASGSLTSKRNRTSLSPLLQYTRKPEGGFPVIHGDGPLHRVKNLDPAQQDTWCVWEGTKAFVSVHACGGGLIQEGQAVSLEIGKALKQIIPDSNITVASPDPETPKSHPNAAPFFYLITGMSEQDKARLILQQVWSLPAITMHITECCLEVSPYIYSVENINSTGEDAHRLFKEAICNDKTAEVILYLVAPYSTLR